MPDISLLVTIAEMYDVDVREIIDGERKEENMNSEVKEVAVKMADYSTMEKKTMLKWIKLMSIASFIVSLCVIVLNWIRTFGIMKKYTTDVSFRVWIWRERYFLPNVWMPMPYCLTYCWHFP